MDLTLLVAGLALTIMRCSGALSRVIYSMPCQSLSCADSDNAGHNINNNQSLLDQALPFSTWIKCLHLARTSRKSISVGKKLPTLWISAC
jgi:hypothetical protein